MATWKKQKEMGPLTRWFGPRNLMIVRSRYARENPWKYMICLRGASPSGCALDIGGADTLKEAKALALELTEENGG